MESFHRLFRSTAENAQLLPTGGPTGLDYRPHPEDLAQDPFHRLVGFSALRRSCNTYSQGVIVHAHDLGGACTGHHPHVDDRVVSRRTDGSLEVGSIGHTGILA